MKININETEASEMYGPSVHWFRRARWQGDGPRFIKLSGAVFYPVSELEAYFNERLVKSTSEVSCRN
jgi:predicted DNA-binding transcriptional regulator AlpA